VCLLRARAWSAVACPVITPDGCGGSDQPHAGDTSDILLSVDPRSASTWYCPRTGGRGILRGKPGENGYRCAIEIPDAGEQAKEGDLVVTSGLAGFRAICRWARSARSPATRPGCRRSWRFRPTWTSRGSPRFWSWSRRAPPADPTRARTNRFPPVTDWGCIADAFHRHPDRRAPAPLLQSTVMEFAPVHLVTPTLGLLTVLYIGSRRSNGRRARRRWWGCRSATSSTWCQGRRAGSTPSSFW